LQLGRLQAFEYIFTTLAHSGKDLIDNEVGKQVKLEKEEADPLLKLMSLVGK